MNDSISKMNIKSYKTLIDEKERLERLIENQKNIIRHDLDELKAEFKKEIKPAIDAANFVKKIARPETRNTTLITASAGLALDLVLKRIFKGSNLLVQVLIPRLIKNYTTHFFNNRIQNKPRSLNSAPQRIKELY
jgi:hypothetical protein